MKRVDSFPDIFMLLKRAESLGKYRIVVDGLSLGVLDDVAIHRQPLCVTHGNLFMVR